MIRLVILIFLMIMFVGCQPSNDEKSIQEPQQISESKPATETSKESHGETMPSKVDPKLLSTYKKETNDGYSWRERDIKYQPNFDIIDKSILCSTKWILSPLINDYIILIFYLDDVFKIGTDEGGVQITGNYRVLNDTTLELYNIKYFSNGWIKQFVEFNNDKNNFVFQKEHQNIWYTDAINCADLKLTFYAEGSESPLGEEYLVNGHKVIKIDELFVVTKDAKYYETPGEKSKSKKHCFYSFGDITVDDIDYFVKGTILGSLGRTTQKYKLGDKENYWYYIYSDYTDNDEGWIFGDYLETYDESKWEEYHKIEQEELEKISKNIPR